MEALRRAEGRAVVVLACDLPLVTADVIRALVAAPVVDRGFVVVAQAGERVQPLCARYEPGALAVLEALGTSGRMLDAVAALGAAAVEVGGDVLTNVNDAAAVGSVERSLRRRTFRT